MNVVLIGFRGAGKTTVARQLAARLGWQSVDLDDQIEQRAGCSIAEIFASQGEAAFRDLESASLAEWIGRPYIALATGGGVVIRSQNRQLLLAHPHVVWLTAPAETLFTRLTADHSTAARRPALTSLAGRDEVRHLLVERRPWYRACARLTLAVQDTSPAQLTAQIIGAWNLPRAREAS